MTDTADTSTIRSHADLVDAWRHLMGPWGFGCHSIWMMLILDDRPLPALTEIPDAKAPPDATVLDKLAETLRLLEGEIVPGARFAFLRSRPGPDVITAADRAWATALHAAARTAGVSCEMVHLATKGSVRPIPHEDVGIVAATA